MSKSFSILAAVACGMICQIFVLNANAEENADPFASAREEIAAKAAERDAEEAKVLASNLAGAEKGFLRKVATGKAFRFELGGGIVMDLIRVDDEDEPFFIGRYEVTQEQFLLVSGDDGFISNKGKAKKYPIRFVSWDTALNFCEFLTAALQKDYPGVSFTLPTREQWTEAAYAGTYSDYSGGDDLEEVGWFSDNSENSVHPVGLKKTNGWGIYDMSGNVWEWGLDEDGADRPILGGSWYNMDDDCAIDYQSDCAHDVRDCGVGFRLVATIPPEILSRGAKTASKVPSFKQARESYARIRETVSEQKARRKAASEAKWMKSVKSRQVAAEASFQQKLKIGEAKRFNLGKDVSLDFCKLENSGNVFFIGRFEVTQGQYQKVMGTNLSYFKGAGRAKLPVENVNWHEAMKFCQVLNTALRKVRGNWRFTLPTSAQWQTAACAGENTLYSGGDDLDDVGWYEANAEGKTHPVGQKEPNALGAYDMSGNVMEWCLDEDGKERVYRGGCWANEAGHCEVFYKDPFGCDPQASDAYMGFRVVLLHDSAGKASPDVVAEGAAD